LDLDKANADVVIAQKHVDLAKIDVDQAFGTDKEKAQLNLDIAQQNLTLAQQSLNMMTSDSNPYEEQAVERSQLAVQRLEKLISERQILAPYDCQVLRSLARPGTQVDAFSTMFVVGDPSNLVVRAPMDNDLQSKLSANSEVSLRLESDPKDAKTTYPTQFLPNFLPITTIQKDNSSSSSGLNTDYLYFTLPKNIPADKVPVGRSVFLTIIQGRKENVLLLPPAAIREYKGLNYVIVQDGNRRRRVEISEIGLKGTDRWEITADLKVGDKVLGP
jgi:multidrug efflux pump subunit AcrA (membrane-fusion protein)